MSSFLSALERNKGSLTDNQQKKLTTGHVAVVGCGGLGGFVIEQLARIGVGKLTVFDPDTFSTSNCNRQINALQSTMGKNKALIAAARVEEMNTGCRISAEPCDFRSFNSEPQPPFDIMVDCLDSIEARYDLAELCNKEIIPLVHGAVSGWYGQVGVQLPGFDLMAQLYPRFKEIQPDPSPPPSVLSFSVVTVASLQAAETVKLLLQLPSSLHNTWMGIDLKNTTFDAMERLG